MYSLLIFSMNKNIYVALYFLYLLKYTNDVMYLFDIFSNTHVDLFCDVFPLTLCSSGRLPPGRFTCDSWRRATSQVPQPTTRGNNRQHAEEGNSQGIKESEQARALGMDQGKGFHFNPVIDGKWGRLPLPRDLQLKSHLGYQY